MERVLTFREVKLASGIDESASVVVDNGMVRVTDMRDLSTGVRTGGMRECWDHLMLCVIALISSAGTTFSTVLDCWP